MKRWTLDATMHLTPSTLGRCATSIAVGLAMCACADIDRVAFDACGNGVLEAGEDCDRFVDERLGAGLRCGAPPDGALACRYVGGADAACPDGWVLRPDGVCHRPTGAFSLAAGTPVDWAADEWVSGDVDGDQHADVAGFVGDGLAARFGDGRGRLDFVARTRSPARRAGRAGAGDLDGDGRLDAVIPTAFGLDVLLGRYDRTAEPVAYAPFVADATDLWIVPVRTLGHAPEVVSVILTGGSPAIARLQLVPDLIPVEGSIALPGSELRGIGTRVPVGDVDGDGVDELVIAFDAQDRVVLITSGKHPNLLGPSCVQTDCLKLASKELLLPEGTSIARASAPGADSAARLADVDGDGALELIVSARTAAGELEVLVARHGGTKALEGWSAFVPDAMFAALASSLVASAPNAARQVLPLLATDLDSDGVADYVSPDGVFLALNPVTRTLVRAGENLRLSAEPWREAVAVDFDADGQIDLAVNDGRSVYFLRGSASADSVSFDARKEVPLEGEPRGLRTGDFDADGIADLALVLGGAAGDGDRVAVIYGARQGWPTELVTLGRFDVVQHMESGAYRDASFWDFATDLLVTVDDGTTAAFGGTSERVMRSPYKLSESFNTFATPRDAFVGRFRSNDTALRDVIVLAESSSQALDLWLVPGAPGAHFTSYADPAPPGAPSHVPFAPPGAPPFALDCADWLVGDADGDGTDELFGIDDPAQCGEASRVPTLAIVRVAHGVIQPCFVAVDELRAPHGMALADLDADGAGDLAINSESEIRLVRGVGSLCTEERVTAEPIASLAGVGLGIAALDTDGDLTPELAVTTAAGTFVVDVAPENVATSRIADESGNRIIAADLDGDGLGELLVGDGTRLSVLLSTSHLTESQ